MSETAEADFCRQCGQNVWLTHEGKGVCGHPAHEIQGVYEVSPAAATSAPVSASDAETGKPEAEAPAAVVASGKDPAVPEGRKRSPFKGLLVGSALVALVALAVVQLYPRLAGAGDRDDSISAGRAHIVGLKSDGTVVATGDNEDRQCDASSWSDITAISAGHAHTVGLKSDGAVVAVGNDEYGQSDVSSWKLDAATTSPLRALLGR